MSERDDRQTDSLQQRFLQQAEQVLDAAEQQIDGNTQSRLRAARREAVAAANPSRLPAWLMPAGGLAVAATVAALTISLWQLPPSDTGFAALDDIALLSDESGPEFYAELDFYRWVAEGAPAADDASTGEQEVSNGTG